ncbi:hypothetical protein C8F04DRAFT_1389100 [Mycena alexandri]|uniref:Uncharacterized protein n=1 Tax=Mycena alexandri TaxID=1745969 RepID=A0AAD6TGA1_9AGAR|nr:hypothetical protein C8F04DRAFT_1389100 [Mycena alexandri]
MPPRTAYACGCLNVRITPVPLDSPSPDVPVSTADFNQVHVADEGISVAHPQVTLRIRTRGEMASRNRRARYTSLTCLICQVLVYRVHQIVSLDADGRDGPLMPTEDWVEQEILKSPSGWIEVHTQCLTGDAIARAEASVQYSRLFSLAIPMTASPPMSPPTSPQVAAEDGPQMSYLAHLPPLFLPPPFTPGHPVFVHLATLAKAESEAQRTAVERDMAEIMRAKSAQLAHTEARLRRQVETVWHRFREGLQSIEQADVSVTSPRSPRSPRSPASRSASGNLGTPASPTIAGTPVARVRDFVPQPVTPTTARQATRPAPISSLSASLASSGLHFPREPTSPTRPASTLSSSSRTLSGSSITLTGSPRTTQHSMSAATVLQFNRKVDEDINTAASFQYFQNLEADMARSRRERSQLATETSTSSAAAPAAAASSSRAGPSTVNGNGTGSKHAVESARPDEHASQDAEASSGGDGGVRDFKGKGKQRKVVTFESQPAVVTIKREVNAEKEEEARLARDGEVMIFDLEPDGKGQSNGAPAEGALITLIEQPAQPRASRPRRTTRRPATDSTGLPQSFSALRPASLPVPSNIVPPRRGPSPPESDIQEEDTEEDEEEEPEELDSRDVQILKLVAANNPSHRGAWKKDSAEWKTLVSRDGRHSSDDDEFEDDGVAPPAHVNGASQAGIPSSMPITIRPLAKAQVNLSLASYRPSTMPPPQELEPEPEPSIPVSSSSVRKAVYAERDLQRAMDPGALDFATDIDSVVEENEEEDEGNDDVDNGGVTATGSAPTDSRRLRGGLKRAQEILKAREDLPDSGMWRSLAS